VTLATARIQEERAFWCGALGLERTPGAPDGGFAVAVGDGVLAFRPAPASAAAPAHHVALEVAPERLVDAAAWLAAAAPLVELDGPEGPEPIVDFPAWAAHSVYAVTPGGHVVELIARHRRPWTPPPGDGGALVRGLSEVGVCAPDVASLVDRLHGLGLERWFGDPASGFAAVGDESGLLICVREWRHWFPTARPAVPGSVSIVLEAVPALHPEDPVAVGSATELRALPT
jgi:catechol 2,3-dioxygenase-like lactoylglutathione lyase family enzyme